MAKANVSSQLLEWHLSVLVLLGRFQLLCWTVQANGEGRKSQLAIEYSQQVRESSPDVWAFWINAGTAT